MSNLDDRLAAIRTTLGDGDTPPTATYDEAATAYLDLIATGIVALANAALGTNSKAAETSGAGMGSAAEKPATPRRRGRGIMPPIDETPAAEPEAAEEPDAAGRPKRAKGTDLPGVSADDFDDFDLDDRDTPPKTPLRSPTAKTPKSRKADPENDPDGDEAREGEDDPIESLVKKAGKKSKGKKKKGKAEK